jgi:vacuolar-type H+-ATPase subunit I/STV1
VFAVFFRGRALAPKIDRICAAFGAATHDVPNFGRPADVAAAEEEARAAVDDAVAWLSHERATSAAALAHIGLLLRRWRMGIAREKAIFATLNCALRAPERGALSLEGWVLESGQADVSETIASAHAGAAAGGRTAP